MRQAETPFACKIALLWRRDNVSNAAEVIEQKKIVRIFHFCELNQIKYVYVNFSTFINSCVNRSVPV